MKIALIVFVAFICLWIEDATGIEYECKSREIKGWCDRSYAPVCARVKYTYGNKCGLCAELGTDQVSFVPGHCDSITGDTETITEKCLDREKAKICTMEYAPVCLIREKSFGNLCQSCYGQTRVQYITGNCI